MIDPHEMESELSLSYQERKAMERGRSFWSQVGDHAALSAVIVAIMIAIAWMTGKL